MVTAPHQLASEAGLAVMRAGGNAIEAMVAAAAVIAVAYPHMNGLGGDGFWLILPPGAPPIGIQACGPAGRQVTGDLYRQRGLDAVPARGALAANTVAGTVAGWTAALEVGATLGGRLSVEQLLEPAIEHAERGVPVSRSLADTLSAKYGELQHLPGFSSAFPRSTVNQGHILRQPRLVTVLRRLAHAGLEDFYRGEVGRRIAADLQRAGSPLLAEDLEGFSARRVEPLSLRISDAILYNLPPPSQGLASLIILGLFERLGVREAESFAHLHGIVEATKQAFLIRDAVVGDPAIMPHDPVQHLTEEALARLSRAIDPARAMPWPRPTDLGDTIWMGAIDGDGCAVSFIQSLYWEFGSGVVLEDTGLLWQNRGSSFAVGEAARHALAPGRMPFHTLNPAAARFDDGRTMVYGTMGGDGQPQTQAAIFTRYARFGQPLSQAIALPRWLLGRTWGAATTTLKLESDIDPTLVHTLRTAGHDVELVAPRNDLMGHAGALVRGADGAIEGASDPRSDGGVAGF
ncbi:MAG TPA: gamma-glutamyltransferase [Alphaproteobacteria bacterium]|nr:gamma-glutamyltransferase [Alphaproteobacteria bacterium]